MIPKSNRINKDGKVTYYYICREKDRTRRINCDSRNVKGNELDKNFINILKDIYVPNLEVYKELKNMSLNNSQVQNITKEIESLRKEHENNEKYIKDLVEKVKYIDISFIDIINKELVKAKKKSQVLKNKIKILDNSKCYNDSKNKLTSEKITYIENIINNCFDIFETFDLKTKKDILNLFVESACGEGDIIEINLLNNKISEYTKKMMCNQLLSSGNRSRQSNDSNTCRAK